MARIIFTVCGVGLGHCMRSMPVIDFLQKDGHEILIASYGQSQKFLKEKFSNVDSLKWFDLVFDKGEYKRLKTVLLNIPSAPKIISSNFFGLLKHAKKFKPDLIISDFDFNSSLLGFMLNIPVVLLSNMHLCEYMPIKMDVKEKIDYALMERPMIYCFPRVDKLLLLGFMRPKKIPKNASFFFHPVRSEIRQARPEKKGFFVVYPPASSPENLLLLLKKFSDKKFVVAGVKEPKVKSPNIEYMDIDKNKFAAMLAQCNGVLSHGGISVICESLFLKKPVYTFTSKSFFERYYNGRLLEEHGMGIVEEAPSLSGLASFFSRLSEFEKNIQKNRFFPSDEEMEKELGTIIKQATSKNAK